MPENQNQSGAETITAEEDALVHVIIDDMTRNALDEELPTTLLKDHLRGNPGIGTGQDDRVRFLDWNFSRFGNHDLDRTAIALHCRHEFGIARLQKFHCFRCRNHRGPLSPRRIPNGEGECPRIPTLSRSGGRR